MLLTHAEACKMLVRSSCSIAMGSYYFLAGYRFDYKTLMN